MKGLLSKLMKYSSNLDVKHHKEIYITQRSVKKVWSFYTRRYMGGVVDTSPPLVPSLSGQLESIYDRLLQIDRSEAPNINTIYEKLLELDKRQP